MEEIESDRYFILQREHNYSKPFSNQENVNGFQTETPPTGHSPFISTLVSDKDTLETVFISLLTLYSQYLAILNGKPYTQSAKTQIDPEALCCLSNEQINFLVTSSSVNYIAIQQILAQKSKQVTPISQSEKEGVSVFSDASTTFIPAVTQAPFVGVDQIAPPTTQPTLSLTSQQMQELQLQLMTLLQQQNVKLNHLTPDQQQLVISSLINQQFQLSQSGGNNVSTGVAGAGNIPVQFSVVPAGNNNSTVVQYSPVASTPVSLTAPQPVTVGSNSAIVENITTIDQTDPASLLLLPTQSKKKKETDANKRPLTPFNIYFSEVYPLVHEEHSNLSFSEASKIVSSQWHKLGQEGKQKYYDRHEQLKLEFNTKQQLQHNSDTPLQNNLTLPSLDLSSGPSHSKTNLQKPPSTKRSRKPSRDNEEMREKTEGMCVANGCYNMAIPTEERGPRYCSNECIINHCKSAYVYWVFQRKQRT